MTAYIAQNPAPQPMPNPPSSAILDWGLAGALVIYLGKEAISFFKQKDANDSKLTDTLIQDLRGESQILLRQNNVLLLEIKALTTAAISERKKVLDSIAEINLAAQVLKRDTGAIYLECRSNRDLLILLEAKIDAIHARLDFEKPVKKREEAATSIAASSILHSENY